MTSKAELYQIIDELPEHTLEAAEAFLAYLRDRAGRPDAPRQGGRQAWAADERRGLDERRRERDAAEQEPDGDDLA